MSYLKQNLIICLIVLAVVGCREPEQIQVHNVPKSQSGLDKFNEAIESSQNPQQAGPAVSAVPSRMVVALVMRPDATWTFKILGPTAGVSAVESSWQEFFSKLRFSDSGAPEFEIPEEWVDGGTRQGMFSTVQTLLLDKESSPVTMEISSLTAGQRLPDNINRWRGQLGLAPVGEEATLPIHKYDGGEYFLFDETGVFSKGMPPFAGGTATMQPPVPRVPEVSQENVVKFDPIDGWEAGEPSQIVKVRLRKESNDGATEITVAQMSSSNEWGINVDEWAHQIGFDGFTTADADERTTELNVAGVSARRVRLIEEDDKFKRGIIGVMFKKADFAWFVKLAGDKADVIAAEGEFDKFVASLKIEQ